MAVFEYSSPDGVRDAVRVIGPNEAIARDFVRSAMEELVRSVDVGTHFGLALAQQADEVVRRVIVDTSHVSDLIHSILRLPEERRPRVTVIGSEFDAYTVVACQIRVDGDD